MKTTTPLARFNALPLSHAEEALTRCCGASRWVTLVVDQRPYRDLETFAAAAQEAFEALAEFDWLEAFAHHPRIGDLGSLQEKFAATARWASAEQEGAATASDAVLRALAKGNDAYADKFGFPFIACATGKSAAELLALLEARLPHSREEELKLAGAEQMKITQLRIDKMLRELP